MEAADVYALAESNQTSPQHIYLVEAYCGANGIPADYNSLQLLLEAQNALYFHLPEVSPGSLADIGRAYIVKRGLPGADADDLAESIDFENIGWLVSERYKVWGRFVFIK